MGSAISLDQPTPQSIPSPSTTRTSAVVATNNRRSSVDIGTQARQKTSAQGYSGPSMMMLPSQSLATTSAPASQQQLVFPPLDEESQEDPASPQNRFPPPQQQQQQPWTMKKRRRDDHDAAAAPEAVVPGDAVRVVGGGLASATITTAAAEEQNNDLEPPSPRALVREDGIYSKTTSPAAAGVLAAAKKHVVDDVENGSPQVMAMPPSILLSPRSESVEKCAANTVQHQLTSFERKVTNNDNAEAEVAEAKRPRTSVTFSITAEVALSRKSSDVADEASRRQSTTVTVVNENCPHKAQRAKPRAKTSKKATEPTHANEAT